MDTDFRERTRHRQSSDRHDRDVESLKQSAMGVVLPSVTLGKPAYVDGLTGSEITPTSQDRHGKREARDTQRAVGRTEHEAIKIGAKIDAIRRINIYGVYSIDQGQDQMMDLLYSRDRHEGMNDLMAQMVAQTIQQMTAQTMALSELHYKLQTERM